MSEIPENSPLPTCSKVSILSEKDDGPSPKRRKTAFDEDPSVKLEHRLGGILCCAVCLDLPPAAVYQCSNGHLMCAPCFTHLLADAQLRDESATCPNCRVEISKTSASRNLAVEKTVSELPSECKFCTRVFPRHALQNHEDKICEDSGNEYKFSQLSVDVASPAAVSGLVRIVVWVVGLLLASFRSRPLDATAHKRRRYRSDVGCCGRLTGCLYERIGCGWRGPAHEASAHEAVCERPQRSAGDVLPALEEREARAADHTRVYTQIFALLSLEKITFNDLQLKPYRTEEFMHKLYYETLRFPSFGHQWVVKAFINNNQPHPTHTAHREITYQLILKSKPQCELSVQWVVARGPFGEARLAPRVSSHTFRGDDDPAPAPLPLADPEDTNRLLSNKAIHFRLLMFLTNK
ncbi:cysteine and histidine-rich protein 1 homolog isoform X1 [Pieris brassicae]|uniref:cysteine and histidine-rich protein 1 homolog isoform X1 n=1 Tax=Pieris brassicae TaxID=7116 RepID=UPI001E6623E8|nr:cysteine and histidine-rich protein 1 homolog isoform X1 [Pieris brassicae]